MTRRCSKCESCAINCNTLTIDEIRNGIESGVFRSVDAEFGGTAAVGIACSGGWVWFDPVGSRTPEQVGAAFVYVVPRRVAARSLRAEQVGEPFHGNRLGGARMSWRGNGRDRLIGIASQHLGARRQSAG